MKKRISVLLVCLLLLMSMAVTAHATHPVPNLEDPGSLTLLMDVDGEPLNSGKLNIYRVGDITEEDGNYFFTLMDGTKVTTDAQVTLELAAQMLNLAKEQQLIARIAPVEEGRAEFHDLDNGLYVVWQATADACESFSPISPFLISVPRYANGEYTLDVVAEPKVPFETEPSTTPPDTPPPPPYLPQTGQLNWPIPALALAGSLLMIIGFIICASKRKCDR